MIRVDSRIDADELAAELARQAAMVARLEAEATAHAQARVALTAALAEKELMMQEVHHRVKNSLQMVQNLLLLQARGASNADTARQLREGAARVNTFASLHHQLYLTADGPHVQVGPYLDGVVRDLREGIVATLDGRSIELDADQAQWRWGDIPTLGLVLTELVTNALKYGRGVVRVSFRQVEGEQAVLTVEDDGDGLPDDFDPTRSRGLGMRMVTRMVGDRGGSLAVDRAAPCSRLMVTMPRERA